MRRLIPQSSHVKYYWYAWLGVIALSAFLRFTVFLDVTQNSRFLIGASYFLGTWIAVMILNLVEGGRIRNYLKDHHNAKWVELTSVFGVPGRFNGLRALPWLYSSDDLRDPVLAQLKEDNRQFIRLMFTMFFTYPVIILIIAI
jgi:hypothetical protein